MGELVLKRRIFGSLKLGKQGLLVEVGRLSYVSVSWKTTLVNFMSLNFLCYFLLCETESYYIPG